MKNYKNLAENYLKEFEGKASFDFRLGVRGFAFELDSLPDQEPKECERCKTVIKNEFNPEFPTSHAGCPCSCHPKDLPKLPEKIDYENKAIIDLADLADAINQILDYLKNKN